MNNLPTIAEIILVLPVLRPAGAERIVAELARRLPGHGFATSVICLEDEREAVGQELTAAGVPVQGLRRSRFRSRACADDLLKRLPARRPLIVHSHLFHANLAARLAFVKMDAASRAGVRVISTVHVAERRFRPWQFWLDRRTASHAHVEVCVSAAVAKFQQAKTGLPGKFFRVIENGIDLNRFSPIVSEAKQEGLKRVISVGRLNAQKDFKTLLQAWKIVNAAVPSATLCIAGEGPEQTRLEKLCKKLALKNVQFPGFARDVPSLLRQADVYVQPSAWEGFGLSVAEAMACQLPVIVSDADSLPEVVTHDRTGIVVPKCQPGAMAQAILDLFSNPGRAAKLAIAARQEAMSRFSVDRMVGDYARLYKELLQL